MVRVLRNNFEIVATVGDGRALVDAARQLQPDVIVADISMPVMSGPEARLAAEMIQAGAAGFVLKHSWGDELATAIREVRQGRVYVSPLISE